jgi:hypothetical protein
MSRERRDATGRIVTEGRRMLLGSCADLGRSGVRRRLRIAETTLSHLLGGTRLPGLQLALLMDEALGIPAKAWRIGSALVVLPSEGSEPEPHSQESGDAA